MSIEEKRQALEHAGGVIPRGAGASWIEDAYDKERPKRDGSAGVVDQALSRKQAVLLSHSRESSATRRAAAETVHAIDALDAAARAETALEELVGALVRSAETALDENKDAAAAALMSARQLASDAGALRQQLKELAGQ